MLILVSGSTRTVRELAAKRVARLGILLTPKNRNSAKHISSLGLSWAMDNGAFSGFDPVGFRRMLRKHAGIPGLLWVACPDVVGDAKGTLALFRDWRGEIASLGFPVAFVGQDGIESETIPWDEFSAWFIGGSTEWKLGRGSCELAREAKRRGKWVHMGRVNSRRRLRIAAEMGCDSVDGSSLSMFGDKYIHKFCRWARQVDEQPLLF